MPIQILKQDSVSDSETKICKVCLINKQLNINFHYHSGHDRYSSICTICVGIRRRAKYANLPEPSQFQVLKRIRKPRKIVQNKLYRHTSIANRKRLDCKHSDKIRGLETDVTIEYIEKLLSLPCIYCGFPSTGLDRLDNKLGHLMSNCVPCCRLCNTTRMNNFTHEEMKLIGKTIREIIISRNGST